MATAFPPRLSWANAVKASLQPRLLRLPILTFAAVHAVIVVLQIPRLGTVTSIKGLLLLPMRPTLFLCSSMAFFFGVLPSLSVRRRLLTRSSLRETLAASDLPSVSFPPTQPYKEWCSTVIAILRLSQVWISALLAGVTSLLFNFALLTSLALYSDNPLTWMPYQRVPSSRFLFQDYESYRTSMGSLPVLRSRSSASSAGVKGPLYWRPKEVVWALMLEPFFLGFSTTIAANIVHDWPVPRLRVPVFPFFETIEAVQAAAVQTGRKADGQASIEGTLAFRVTSILPKRIATAAVSYLIFSQVILLSYLPLRLPLFKLLLILLPPYSQLRRLVIPSLQTQYSIFASSNLFNLFGVAAISSLAQGAIQALAANLWEIYATHPLSITVASDVTLTSGNGPRFGSEMRQGGKSSPLTTVENLLQALEAYGPAADGSFSRAASEGPSERFFLIHALLDLAILAQQQQVSSSADEEASRRRRRDFWKHFSPRSNQTSDGEINCYGLAQQNNLAGGTVSAWERSSEVLLRIVRGETAQLLQPPVSSMNSTTERKPATSSSAIKLPTSTSGNSSGSSVVSASRVVLRAGAPSTDSKSSDQEPSKQRESESQFNRQQFNTVWQRLVATPARIDQPAVSAQPQQPMGSVSTTQSSSVWALVQRAIPGQILTIFKASMPANTPQDDALVALLCTTTPLLLLSLSLQEDEWGSVTLSERRDLGLDAWLEATERLVKAAENHISTSAAAGSQTVQQRKRLEWSAFVEETRARLKGVRVDFALGLSNVGAASTHNARTDLN